MRDRHPSPRSLPPGALVRYLAEESDPGERERVERWAAASAERREYLAALARSWSLSRGGATSAELRDTDAAWAALRARLDDYDSALHSGEGLGGGGASEDSPRAPAPRRAFIIPGAGGAGVRRPWLPAVAAALVVAAGAGALRYFSSERSEAPVPAVVQAPMREVVTGVGERARIRLEDGTTIVLAARSRLGIPADFGVRAREVETEGEAYFRVAHDSTLPFIVRTRGARTVDVGTAFVVRAYPEDSQVSVVVTEGSVTLGADPRADSARSPAPAATLLHSGQLGNLRDGARVPEVTTVDPTHYTGWVDGRLSFDNAPLAEVIADLGRWHTTKLLLADSSLARETVTASLAADSFDEALRTLTTVLSLRAERRGSSVVLHRRRGSHQ